MSDYKFQDSKTALCAIKLPASFALAPQTLICVLNTYTLTWSLLLKIICFILSDSLFFLQISKSSKHKNFFTLSNSLKSSKKIEKKGKKYFVLSYKTFNILKKKQRKISKEYGRKRWKK